MEKNSSSRDLRKHIVVAEHDKGLRRTLSLTLKGEHHEISMVGSCAEALASMEERWQSGETVDLVIIDLNSREPECNELAGRLATTSPRIPLLLITRYGEEETAAPAIAARSSRRLSKPFESWELLREIEVIFNQHGSSGAV